MPSSNKDPYDTIWRRRTSDMLRLCKEANELEGVDRMSEVCPTCGEDSLMMVNIGFIFGVMPWCANKKCRDYSPAVMEG